MRGKRTTVVAVVLSIILPLSFLPALSCDKTQSVSLWERHCEACHDGKTVLNGKVLIDKEHIREKYRTLDEFTGACVNSPVCMNIVKHEEALLTKVGTEIGIKPAPKK